MFIQLSCRSSVFLSFNRSKCFPGLPHSVYISSDIIWSFLPDFICILFICVQLQSEQTEEREKCREQIKKLTKNISNNNKYKIKRRRKKLKWSPKTKESCASKSSRNVKMVTSTALLNKYIFFSVVRLSDAKDDFKLSLSLSLFFLFSSHAWP